MDSNASIELLCDTHAHLLETKNKSPDNFHLFADNLSRMAFVLDVGITLEDLEQRLSLISSLALRYFSVGLYPSLLREPNYRDLLLQLEHILHVQLATHAFPRCIALGEIGIDHFRNYGPGQKDFFANQVALANKHNLPIIVHCRQSENDILDVLSACRPQAGGIMHCFSSSKAEAQKFLDFGLYISFAGNITYKNSQNIQECATYVPLDRLLSETDCPYLTPMPERKGINTPLRVASVLHTLSELKQISTLTMAEQIRENVATLFRV